MSRASGAERRRRLAAKVASGAVPARRVSHFQTTDVRAAVQDDLAAQRAVLEAQRTRARRPWAFQPTAAKAAPVSVLEGAGAPCESLTHRR